MQMSEMFTKSFVNKEDAYTITVKEKFKVLYTIWSQLHSHWKMLSPLFNWTQELGEKKTLQKPRYTRTQK